MKLHMHQVFIVNTDGIYLTMTNKSRTSQITVNLTTVINWSNSGHSHNGKTSISTSQPITLDMFPLTYGSKFRR